MRHRAVRALVLGVVVLALLGLFFALGGDDVVRDPDDLQAFVERRGVWGPVLFVLLMWAVQPFGVPGVVFMVPAGLVWSLPVAFALSWIGNMGASAIAFAFARRVGRDWVAGRIPPRVARWDERLVDGGTLEVLGLRVLTGQLPPADWLLGVSSVRWRPFLIGTAIGIVPGILLALIAGVGLLSWLADHPVATLLGAVAATVVGVAMARRSKGGA